ncbi:MAG TPA: Chromate resistance protein ChrB [Aggregatilineales bacterium]|nr:Chromate resistance protein ChrB [Aggregatilineales bacterium]
MDYQRWLLFCSQLPATPSSPRVMIWRRLRASGATGLQNGVWVLPHSVEHEKLAEELQTYVEQQGGTSQVLTAASFNSSTEARILDLFRADREQEYLEFKEQCQDFLGEIDKEVRRENFSYAEYEENEENFNKLVDWLAKIQRRDFTGGAEAAEAPKLLESCRQALQVFADVVYGHEGGTPDHNPPRNTDSRPDGA